MISVRGSCTGLAILATSSFLCISNAVSHQKQFLTFAGFEISYLALCLLRSYRFTPLTRLSPGNWWGYHLGCIRPSFYLSNNVARRRIPCRNCQLADSAEDEHRSRTPGQGESFSFRVFRCYTQRLIKLSQIRCLKNLPQCEYASLRFKKNPPSYKRISINLEKYLSSPNQEKQKRPQYFTVITLMQHFSHFPSNLRRNKNVKLFSNINDGL